MCTYLSLHVTLSTGHLLERAELHVTASVSAVGYITAQFHRTTSRHV